MELDTLAVTKWDETADDMEIASSVFRHYSEQVRKGNCTEQQNKDAVRLRKRAEKLIEDLRALSRSLPD